MASQYTGAVPCTKEKVAHTRTRTSLFAFTFGDGIVCGKTAPLLLVKSKLRRQIRTLFVQKLNVGRGKKRVSQNAGNGMLS